MPGAPSQATERRRLLMRQCIMPAQAPLACSALSGPCFQPSASPVAHPEAAPFQAAWPGRARETTARHKIRALCSRPAKVGLRRAEHGNQLDEMGTARAAAVAVQSASLLKRQGPPLGHSPSCLRRRRSMKQFTAAYSPPMIAKVCSNSRSSSMGASASSQPCLGSGSAGRVAAAGADSSSGSARHGTANPPWPTPSPLLGTPSTAHFCACASSSHLAGVSRVRPGRQRAE